MLLKTHPLKRSLLMAAVALLVCTGAIAQDASKPANKVGFTGVPYIDKAVDDPELSAQARATGEKMVNDILSSYQTLATQEMADDAQRLKHRADDIADAGMASERDKIMDFLGIDPQSNSGLYYFVSWSMPLELLRAIVIDAMWAGGTVVFKGVPPGKDLGKFIVNDLRQLVYGKGAAANLSIDPRLFDAYSVQTVPTIVFTTVRGNMQCQGAARVPVNVGNIAVGYDTCPALDPASYWKITGAVTTNYALSLFIDDGAVTAKPYLEALARGWREGTAPGKEQKPFAGKWEDAISPSEILAAQEAANTMTKPQSPAK